MGPINATGLMDLTLYERIAKKAVEQHRVTGIGLFNWADPILHPELPEFIRITKKHKLDCHVGSNLNVMKRHEAVLAANPDHFRISLSGFTQATYSTTHVQGDIERVKDIMRILSEAKKKTRGNCTRITVYFHKYRDNLHEVEPMKKLAESHGFSWMENWAYYMPYEKAVQLVENTLPDAERQFVDSKFALPILPSIALAKNTEGDKPCPLLKNQLTVDHLGNLVICCAVYDLAANRLGSFVELTEDQIVSLMRRHKTCDTCFSHGLHRYFSYYDSPALKKGFDRLAKDNSSNPTLVSIQ
jgi:MoaA/NifB/PqqE/SkfB family radical SAM enzyme